VSAQAAVAPVTLQRMLPPEEAARGDFYALLAGLFVAPPSAALLAQLAAIAAMSGNLARLEREYRRTVRRVRALEDVLIPETAGTLAAIEERLEELEREEAQWSRAFLNERLAGG